MMITGTTITWDQLWEALYESVLMVSISLSLAP